MKMLTFRFEPDIIDQLHSIAKSQADGYGRLPPIAEVVRRLVRAEAQRIKRKKNAAVAEVSETAT